MPHYRGVSASRTRELGRVGLAGLAAVPAARSPARHRTDDRGGPPCERREHRGRQRNRSVCLVGRRSSSRPVLLNAKKLTEAKLRGDAVRHLGRRDPQSISTERSLPALYCTTDKRPGGATFIATRFSTRLPDVRLIARDEPHSYGSDRPIAALGDSVESRIFDPTAVTAKSLSFILIGRIITM